MNPEPPSSALDSAKVLLVCREEKTLALLAQILSRIGHQVLTAQTPEDAWECLKSGQVCLIVLDLTNSNPDQVMFLRAVRSSSRTAEIPMLFITRSGYKPPLLLPLGEECARDGWLPVPCPSQHFSQLVRQIMEQRDSRSPNLPASDAASGFLPVPAEAAPVPAGVSPGLLPPDPAPLRSGQPAAEAAMVPAPSLPPGLFAGQLGALDITKILGLLETLRLTGTLTVSDDKREGKIHFVEGSVWHAELAGIQGPDALFLLFHLKTGEFRFDIGLPAAERTIQGNTMGLLLEGLRQMDEAKTIIKRLQERRNSLAGRPPQAN